MYRVKCRIKDTSPPLHTVNNFVTWHEAMDFASDAEWSEVSDYDGPVAVCINGEWLVEREHEMSHTIENGEYNEEMSDDELFDDLIGRGRTADEDDDDDLLGDMPVTKKSKKGKPVKGKLKTKGNGKLKSKADDDEPKKKRKGGPRTKRAAWPDTGIIRIIKPRRVRAGTNAALVYNCIKDGMSVRKFKQAAEKAGSTKDPNGSLHWLVNSGNIRVK